MSTVVNISDLKDHLSAYLREVRRGATVRSGHSTTKLTISLREGRNRQVRKMCQAIGHPVRALTRVRMGSITLGTLRPGEWRELGAAEIAALKGGSEAAQAGRRPAGLASPVRRSLRERR